ncbi:unnamed protein product [Strongylus vulgaris]|uniref:Uncharacterized protein n=1 Tax=Strongylus vulgaris TaxID=40348 RepID=A0A3P7IYJ9_STRVU|nr:unnamed protein product [Strongylus vulgaris]
MQALLYHTAHNVNRDDFGVYLFRVRDRRVIVRAFERERERETRHKNMPRNRCSRLLSVGVLRWWSSDIRDGAALLTNLRHRLSVVALERFLGELKERNEVHKMMRAYEFVTNTPVKLDEHREYLVDDVALVRSSPPLSPRMKGEEILQQILTRERRR